MDCDQARNLLGAYADGELDLVSNIEIEKHLESCTSCQTALEQQRMLKGLIQEKLTRHQAPAFLRTRVEALVRERAQEKAPWSRWMHVLEFKWALGTGALVPLLFLVFMLGKSSLGDGLVDEAVANHVRSLMANHLADVASTDQHTVKPWFNGRVDFSPNVIDLAPEGYPLIGGRLDVLQQQPVAALIYQRRKHFINLFIWPVNSKSIASGFHSHRGFQVQAWTKSDMNYLAVSDLGENELKQFVHMIQEQTN